MPDVPPTVPDADPDAAAPLPTSQGRGGVGASRLRAVAAGALGVLAVAGAVVSMFGWWARSTAFDSDRFADAVEAALERPEVTRSLSIRVADEVLAAIDVDDVVDRVVPGPLAPLRPIVIAGVRELAVDATDRVLSADRTRAVLVGTSRRAHLATVRMVRGEALPPGVRVEGDEVSLNLLPVLGSALERLADAGLLPGVAIPELRFDGDPAEQLRALEAAFGRELRPDLGQVVVYRGDSVSEAGALVARVRDLIVAADRALAALVALTVASAVGSVALANDRRRAVVFVALGLGAAFVVARALVTRVTDEAPLVVTDDGARLAIAVTLDRLVSGLMVAVTATSMVGFAAAAIAFATGPGAGASSLRQTLVQRRDAVGVGSVSLALVVVTVGRASTESLILGGIALLLGLGGPWVAARGDDRPNLRRRVPREPVS